jgi:hypothetical protein
MPPYYAPAFLSPRVSLTELSDASRLPKTLGCQQTAWDFVHPASQCLSHHHHRRPRPPPKATGWH